MTGHADTGHADIGHADVEHAETVALLRTAADIIDSDGWHQGGTCRDGPDSGPCCPLGALSRALRAHPRASLSRAADALLWGGRIQPGPSGPRVADIIRWNDHPDRTRAAVTATLRRAADWLTRAILCPPIRA